MSNRRDDLRLDFRPSGEFAAALKRIKDIWASLQAQPIFREMERTDAMLPEAFKAAAAQARGNLTTEQEAVALFDLAAPAYRWGSGPCYGRYRRERDDFLCACLRHAAHFSAIVRGIPAYDSTEDCLVNALHKSLGVPKDIIRHAWRNRRILNWGRRRRERLVKK